ncbi:cytochrome P450 [Syncephalis plumigaleata]|nr:cytochrome P450 [Syncephalis plumigaleata]
MPILSTLLNPLMDILDWQFVGIAAGTLLISQIVYDEFFSLSSKIPGKRPVTLTRFTFIRDIMNGTMMHSHAALSEKYGKVILTRPGSVSIGDIDAVRTISMSTKLIKADGYNALQFHKDNIFSTQDNILHRRLKRTIGPVFSLASVNELEPYIYEAGIARLLERINTYAETKTSFDIMELLHYTTLDVIGAVSFGGSFNTLVVKPGEKPHPIIHWISDITMLGIMRQALGPLLCNRLFFYRYFKSEKQIVEFTRNVILERAAKVLEKEDESIAEGTGKDVLLRLIESEDAETGEKLDIDQLIAESIIQLIGGTDTTALTTTWALHLLHDNPHVCQKLFEEIKEVSPDRTGIIHHQDVKNLPYLNATIYEAMRMRPVAGGTARKSPPGGIELAGVHIPENFSIGVTVLHIHFSKEIYGEDADKFRPERWIEADSETLKRMRQGFLTFSMGPRSCIGQNLAWMELRLLVATLVRQFEFTVADMTPVLRFTSQPRDGCYKVRATLRAN